MRCWIWRKWLLSVEKFPSLISWSTSSSPRCGKELWSQNPKPVHSRSRYQRWINLNQSHNYRIKSRRLCCTYLEFKQIRQFSFRLFTLQWYPWPMTADKEWNGIIHVSVLRLNSIIHIFFQANPPRSSNRICQILFF